ncbi:unnamed protein product [Phaeothamnion confervicola]
MRETFTPANAAQLRDIIALAASVRLGLRVQGHNSKSGLGTPVDAGQALDLSRLSGILSYQPEELVLSAQAGTPMTEIMAALRPHRQHLAFEPPDWGPLFGAVEGRGTIGGIIACNASGPRRFKAGAARDHFLGFSAINGRGENFKAGGQVVKNVTGYDLPKLLAGSHGTLAVLTEVTVKVLPAPMDAATLIIRDLTDRMALQALRLAANSTLELSALAHLPAGMAGDRSQTLFRLEGEIASVTERSGRLKILLQEFGVCESLSANAAHAIWRRVRDADFFVQDAQPLWRISIPASDAVVVAAGIGASRYYFDWAGGLIWLLCDDAVKVRAAVAPTGGHATLFRATEEMRRSVAVFEPQTAPLMALEQRVREAFDPLRIFNPCQI